MRKLARAVTVALLVSLLLAVAAFAAVGEWLTWPARATIPDPPADLSATEFVVVGREGLVQGWQVPGRPGGGVVLLLHSVRANRTQMLDRARLLQRAGYGAVLLDLPAHGESAGTRITFGAREAFAVRVALDHMRRSFPSERIAVLGMSLGAASFVLSDEDDPPAAVVLESMYPTIRAAIVNRLTMRFGPAGRLLADPLLWQFPLRLGIGEDDLRPIDRLARIKSPVAIAAGTRDQHTTWDETQRLFDAASAPKELWRFEGAAHQDLLAFAPALYEERLLRFLQAHLRDGR